MDHMIFETAQQNESKITFEIAINAACVVS